MRMEREHWMRLAMAEAGKCAETGDVPIGCVIVRNGKAIAFGHNTRELSHSATGHAEIMAIEEACRVCGDWRLCGCELYVTLEPCPMCAGAILNARIPVVCFGARDSEWGACGSVLDLFSEHFGFHPAVYAGVLADECTGMLQSFFTRMRRRKPENKDRDAF